MSKKQTKRACYTQEAEKFKNQLQGRPYRLGLDLGVGSIGYCAVVLEEKNEELYPGEVIILGSRIFSASTGAAERREKRGQRNSIRHKRNRLTYLWKLLAQYNMMLPFTQKLTQNTADTRFSAEVQKQDPYELRYKGLKQELSLQELGYCLYHIANHRGSSSVRTFLDEAQSDEEKKQREQENTTTQLAKENNLTTYIEILYEANKEKTLGFRNLQSRKDIPLPTRDVILSEVQQLLTTQKQFHSILTDSVIQKITDAINYENEKLVPEAGNCPFFPTELKLPKCHFLNEERRLYEALNNASVAEPINERDTVIYKARPFSQEDKQILFKYLRSGNTITGQTVKKLLPQYENYKIILQGKTEGTQKLVGFRFKTLEEKKFWQQFTDDQKDSFLALWVNCPDDQKLIKKLVSDYNLTPEEAQDALRTVQLIGDYAPVGKTAMTILLDYIKNGESWTVALDKAVEDGKLPVETKKTVYDKLPYYGEILTGKTQALMGKAWHTAFKDKINSPGFTKPHTCSKEDKYGRIANPVVHQVLNETQKLVNELIEVLGQKPAEIAIETSRELKIGEEKRDKLSKAQNAREKQREELYKQYCVPQNLPPRYIKAFDLLEKQNLTCPYCLEAINPDAVAQNKVDIDHIFPEADTGDSSESNLVLAHRSCNATKGKRIPFAAFGGTEKWASILHYLEDNPNMRSKRWRFLCTEEEYANYLKNRGFTSRFKSDTSYITKAAQEYLACLYPQKINHKGLPVTTLQGGITAVLRNAWNLQSITHELGNLHILKDDTQGLDTKKNRMDNRHHALDALVIAYCTRSYVQLINTLHGKNIPLSYAEKKIPVPGNLADYVDRIDENFNDYASVFQEEVRDLLKNKARVSLKCDTNKNGQLLKDTIYNILIADKNDLVFLVKKKLIAIDTTKITGELPTAISEILIPKMFSGDKLQNRKPEEKEKIEKLIAHNQRQCEAVLANLIGAKAALQEENEIAKKEGKRERAITDAAVAKKAFETTGGFYWSLSNVTRQKVFVAKEPTADTKGFAYDTGENLCIDFYHDNTGKLQAEIIRKVEWNKKGFEPRYKKQGYTLLERIYQGDTLEIEAPEVQPGKKEAAINKLSRIHLPNSLAHRAIVRVGTFTETGNTVQIYFSHIAKSKIGQDASFTISSMQKCNVRKIILSSLGFVEYVSPILKDKDMSHNHVENT